MPPTPEKRLRLAVWKFSSCDGCQLSLLNCEDQLLALAQRIEIAYFAEASSTLDAGPYDLSLVEGSISTAADEERIREIRDQSGVLVAIGACATAGGVQALRNSRDMAQLVAAVYPRPELVTALPTSTPIADHVDVDAELRGCPIDAGQLVELIVSRLTGRPARIPTTSVCGECKARGQVCVMVRDGTACLGPVTQAGCGALCPAVHRGCYGCFGPMESANTSALADHFRDSGIDEDIGRLFRNVSAAAPAFASEAQRQLELAGRTPSRHDEVE
jgi:coenzyme F420-reducing hydrogenase gamma subunit